jgi:uncharacterized protein YueI
LIISVCELAKKANSQGELKKTFIDGEILPKQSETIEKILTDLEINTEIISGKKLDTTIGLVNEADNRANFLFRYYISKSKDKKKYLDKIIIPDIEFYLRYLHKK